MITVRYTLNGVLHSQMCATVRSGELFISDIKQWAFDRGITFAVA